MHSKILIVEDFGLIAKDLQIQLENWGYKITGILDKGEDAIKEITETKPDLIIMDILLKGELDGIETTKQIEKKYDIPVIFLTAYRDSKIMKKIKKTNAVNFLLKPFDNTLLQTAVEQAI